MKIKIDPDKKITENAARYYEKGKKYKAKIEGAEKAIEETKKLLKEAKKQKKEQKKELKKIKNPDEWYDKFHWFRTRNDYLVIAGKNAEQNQEIVRNYLENEDLYFHAVVEGAPSVVLKRGKKAPEEDKKEAAQFAGSYSSAWKDGFTVTDVYHVTPKQVKLGAGSGEYLGTGAFRIEGKKNFYKNTELKIAFTILEQQIQVAPPSALEGKINKYVLIQPGETEKNKASKKIKQKLVEKFNVKIDLNWVLEKMPPNGCRIIN